MRPPALCASSPPGSSQSAFVLLSDWMLWDSSLRCQLIIATQMLGSKLSQARGMLPQAAFRWDGLLGEALLHVFLILLLRPEGCLRTALLARAEVQEGKHKLAKTCEAKAKLACHHSTLFCWARRVVLPSPRHRKIDLSPYGKKVQGPTGRSMPRGPLKQSTASSRE